MSPRLRGTRGSRRTFTRLLEPMFFKLLANSGFVKERVAFVKIILLWNKKPKASWSDFYLVLRLSALESRLGTRLDRTLDTTPVDIVSCALWLAAQTPDSICYSPPGSILVLTPFFDAGCLLIWYMIKKLFTSVSVNIGRYLSHDFVAR